MEQKVSKKSRRMWSVIISIRAKGNELVKAGKFGYVRNKEYVVEFCHTSVTKFYKKGNTLYIMEGKKQHIYDGSRIEMIQIREHKRIGIQ